MVILSTWSQSLYDIIIFDHISPLYQNHQLKKKTQKKTLSPICSHQSPPIFPNISTGRLWSCRFLQVCWICVEAIRSTSSLPPRRKVSSNGRCCHKRRKVKRSYGIMMDKFGIWLGKNGYPYVLPSDIYIYKYGLSQLKSKFSNLIGI